VDFYIVNLIYVATPVSFETGKTFTREIYPQCERVLSDELSLRYRDDTVSTLLPYHHKKETRKCISLAIKKYQIITVKACARGGKTEPGCDQEILRFI